VREKSKLFETKIKIKLTGYEKRSSNLITSRTSSARVNIQNLLKVIFLRGAQGWGLAAD